VRISGASVVRKDGASRSAGGERVFGIGACMALRGPVWRSALDRPNSMVVVWSIAIAADNMVSLNVPACALYYVGVGYKVQSTSRGESRGRG
jgi:hypothetical protein